MSFMVWGVGGRGRLGSESKELHETVIIFMSLEVGGRGAGGSRIIRNAWDGQHFHGFGSGWEVGAWHQNHKKRMGLLSFSKFSKCLEHME